MATEIVAVEVEGWGEYRKLILAELERLSRCVGDVDRKLDSFRADEIGKLRAEMAKLELNVATMKTTLDLKSSVWGALGGAIPAALAALIWYMSK
jgi:hypothetical protein